MFSLISNEDVRTRLRLPTDDGVVAMLDATIPAASPYLEAATQSKFDKQSRTDYFYVNPSVDLSYGGVFVLKLSSGFVRSDTDIVVNHSDQLMDLQSIALSISTAAPLRIDMERGFVYLSESYVAYPTYVRVDYDCGFGDTEEVPQWLQEAALCQVIRALSAIQINDGQPELSDAYKYMLSQQTVILDSHSRTMSRSVRALL